jgi:hypothetical protein
MYPPTVVRTMLRSRARVATTLRAGGLATGRLQARITIATKTA